MTLGRTNLFSVSLALFFGASVSPLGAADFGVYAARRHHVHAARERLDCYRSALSQTDVDTLAENGILNGAIGAWLGDGARPKFNNDDTGFTYDNGYRAYMACRRLDARRSVR